MIAARVTDGVKPVITAYPQSSIIVMISRVRLYPIIDKGSKIIAMIMAINPT